MNGASLSENSTSTDGGLTYPPPGQYDPEDSERSEDNPFFHKEVSNSSEATEPSAEIPIEPEPLIRFLPYVPEKPRHGCLVNTYHCFGILVALLSFVLTPIIFIFPLILGLCCWRCLRANRAKKTFEPHLFITAASLIFWSVVFLLLGVVTLFLIAPLAIPLLLLALGHLMMLTDLIHA